MTNNLFNKQHDVTQKSKLRKFYESYKYFIFSFAIILIISLASFSFYIESQKDKKIFLSEKYINAKIYLEEGNKKKATDTLKDLVYANDKAYSTLGLFLIINQNLITDYKELFGMFDHLLLNNRFSKEDRNLLIYKKLVHASNFAAESDMLSYAKPLLNNQSLWESHALLLLGDYFLARGESIKAIEFYQKIFNIKNLHVDLYSHARSQLAKISNE